MRGLSFPTANIIVYYTRNDYAEYQIPIGYKKY